MVQRVVQRRMAALRWAGPSPWCSAGGSVDDTVELPGYHTATIIELMFDTKHLGVAAATGDRAA